MNDYDKILESFEPEQFQRKDLRKQLLPVSAYTIKLDIYAEWLEELLEETEEELKEAEAKIGRAGSPQYMADAKEWGTQWNAKLRENGELQARLITLEAEKNAEIRKLQLENEWLHDQNEIANQKITDLQQQVLEYEASGTRVQRTRDSSGRFSSSLSKKEKQKIAYYMRQDDISWAKIGKRLDVNPDTAKQYAEEYARWLRYYRRPVGGEENEQREQSDNSYW